MMADFEVIKIMDDNNPYPAHLGIDWATNMNGVINLKKQKMIFEKKSVCIIVPLDLLKDRAILKLSTIMRVMMTWTVSIR